MRWLIIIISGLFLSMTGVRAEAFLADAPDIPLPPPLLEDRQNAFLFDKPEGRILYTAARGSYDKQQLIGFYQDSLPNLGWMMELYDPNAAILYFYRRKERLMIRFEAEQLVFDIRPTK